MQTKAKFSELARSLFRLCPIRHVLTLAGIALIAAYFALRNSRPLMETLAGRFVAPVHRLMAAACSCVRFSVAEALIALFFTALIIYILCTLVSSVRRRQALCGLYKIFAACLMCFVLVYGGFCLLWGVYYSAADFEEASGIHGEAMSVDRLETVTRYFALLANRCSSDVERDADGLFAVELEDILGRAPTLYREAERLFPCLEGQELRPKPFCFSKMLSAIGFTGFFFPFTGEANINTDSPACMIPSTVAHELAHQRGVAEEDEANFVAVLACLESGDPVYRYSAALLAYIHLGNALHDADYERWSAIYALLNGEVRADLSDNNRYWAAFETPVSDASDAVYSGFLRSYGQQLGLKTYGACVDLLAAYYGDAAMNTE